MLVVCNIYARDVCKIMNVKNGQENERVDFFKIFFCHSNLQELRIGVVQDFTLMLTVANKAEDSAYYSQISVKHPADLDYIGPIQVRSTAV